MDSSPGTDISRLNQNKKKNSEIGYFQFNTFPGHIIYPLFNQRYLLSTCTHSMSCTQQTVSDHPNFLKYVHYNAGQTTAIPIYTVLHTILCTVSYNNTHMYMSYLLPECVCLAADVRNFITHTYQQQRSQLVVIRVPAQTHKNHTATN